MAERKEVRSLANVLILVIITSILIYPVYKLVIHLEDHNFDGDFNSSKTGKGPFKYYVIKEVGGWGQKMAILDDLQYCKSSKIWVGGPKKVKNMMT